MPDPRRMDRLLLAAAGLILLQQLFDVGAGMLTGDRYTLVRLLWTRLPALLTANVCLILAVVRLDSRRGAMALSVVHYLLGVGVGVLAMLFLLDSGQRAGSVPVQGLDSFRMNVVRVLVGSLCLGLGWIWAGMALPRSILKKT